MRIGRPRGVRPLRLLLLALAIVQLVRWTSALGLAGGIWSAEISLPVAVQEVSVAALNNQVYVIGGSSSQFRVNTVYRFDPLSPGWIARAPYPGTPRDHIGVAAVQGFLYVLGGVAEWPAPSVETVQRYDPSTDTWTTVAPLPTARGAMAVAALNNKIYAAGGLVNGASVADFTVYDPATNKWKALPPMPTPRDHAVGVALNGQFYVTGGRSQGICSPLATVEVFDPAAGVWRSAAPMKYARGGHGAAAVDGSLYVFGGEGGAGTCGIIPSTEEYNPATNTWTDTAPMPTPRHGTGGAVIGSTVYVPGGATQQGDAPTSVVEKFTTSTTQALPAPWTSMDIGAVGLAGSATHSNGVFTIKGAGADIWGTDDSFHFVHQPVTGDVNIVARVTAVQNTHEYAKAGIMLRGSLATNAPHVILSYMPGGEIEFMTRSSTGAQTTYPTRVSGASLPVWLRLTRTGAQVTGYWSTNGTAWIQIGTASPTLPATVYAGLPVLSHDTRVLNTATLDNVAVTTPTTTNPPPTVAITAPANGATFTAPASVTITASASDSNGTVTGVQFFVNGASVGTDTTSPYSVSWNGPSVGTHTLTAVATDSGSAQAQSSPVTVTVAAASSSPLPAPWTAIDIGNVGATGSATTSGGIFTVKGAGEDIWGPTDAFSFVHQTVSGDQQIVARVTSLQNTHPNAKAGVMVRESLDANARHVTMNLTPSVGQEFLRRATPGGLTVVTSGRSQGAPYWVKLVRQGNVFSGYTSADGNVWELIGSDTIAMGSAVYAGLAVTSHSYSVLTTATFENVSASPPGDGAPLPPIPRSTLTDSFDDNQRDTAKWYRGAVTYFGYIGDENGDYHPASDMLVRTVEQNGRLEITPRVNTGGRRYNGYVSVNTFDFSGKHAGVQAVQAPNPSSAADMVFSVAANEYNWYRFHVVLGSLLLEATVGGAQTTSTIAYSPTQHKFWRLRHHAGTNTIIWETSADRSSWVVQRTAALAISLANVRVELVAGTHQKESQPGIAIFDTFRLEPDTPAGTNKPPVADPGGPYTGTAGQPVQFNGSASYDPDGTIAQYYWNFGDGSTATGATVTHSYATPGVYNAVLKVTDSVGATTSASAKTTQIVPSVVGQWSRPVDLPIVGVHVHVLPTGKLLMWQHESTSVPYLWDAVANSGTFEPVPIHSNQNGTRRDSIYCSGHSFLPDGRLFATGGHLEPLDDTVHGSKLTNIFDPALGKWFSGPDMNDGRWYPSNVTLGDGSTLVLSGSIDDNFADQGVEGYPYRVNQLPQVYGLNGQFRSLTSALMKLPLYPMAYLAPNGKAFVAGPAKLTQYLDTAGTGAWTVVGNSNYGNRPYGASVMYEPGKILLVGGDQDAPTKTAEVIDLNVASPSWRYVGSTEVGRTRASATVLPDGKVLIGGGHSTSGFSPGAGAVMTTEMWDPATEQWSKMADASVARLHHSAALLLPDAPVLFLGGGQPTGVGDYEHYDAEFYSPPYLFKGPRPTISVAPSKVTHGQTFTIDTPDVTSISQVTWIRLPSMTHHFNQNQGINKLTFTKTPTGLSVTAPSSGNLAPPGPYMLFILNGSGVPSVAKIVTLENVTPPLAPGNLVANAGSATQVTLTWTDTSTNEAGFKIERCVGSTCTSFVEIGQTTAGTASYSDVGLTASTTYRYRVRAFNPAGNSAYSNIASATTVALPPAAPTNLAASAASSTAANLAWTDNATDEAGFRIERCQGSGCANFTEVAQVGANVSTFGDTGLTASTSYSYRVRAFNAAGTSGYSNTASTTTIAPPPAAPAAPAKLAAVAVSSTQIALTWGDMSSDESGFKIERCTGLTCTAFVQVAQVGVNVTGYDDMGVAAGTAYTYRVASFNGAGAAYSNTAQASTPEAPPAPPTAPSALTATAQSSDRIALAWQDASSDESGFRIERCTGVGCTTFVQIAQTAANVITLGDTGLLGGTSYTYRLRAYNSAGDSGHSNTATATTPAPAPTAPAAPTNLSAAAVSSSRIDLTWTDAATDETGFKVERCAGTCSNFVEVAQLGANASSYSDIGRTADTTYTYRVRAYNAAGGSPYAGPVEARTLPAPPPPPAAPSNLVLSVVSTTQIDLAWVDNSTDESSFKIERCTGTGCTNFVQIAEVAADVNGYANTNLQAGTSYSYRVRARGAGGDSAYAESATATTHAPAPTVPAAPGNLAARAVSASQIDLNWSDNSSDEDGFLIERCFGSACVDFVQIAQTAAGVTTFANTGLASNTTYSYRVRAYNIVGPSGYANTAEATTQEAPVAAPAAPTNLVSTAVSSTQIDLTWTDASTNESGFRVERCNGAGCTNFVEVAQVSANLQRYSDTTLVGSTTYSYRVRAVNTGGSSPYSNVSEATTPPAPPLAPNSLTATAVSSTQVNLAWTDSATDEAGFRVERCEGVGCATFAEIGQTAANVTSYSDLQRAPGTSYTYRVRAFNTGGTSAYSNSASVTTAVAAPAAPSSLTATLIASTTIGLAWIDNSTDETGFSIERCQGTGCTNFLPLAQAGQNVTGYTDAGLLPGTTYTYRVRAFNGGGNSSYSAAASAATPAPTVPSPPTNLTASSPTHRRVDLEWVDNSGDETGFRLERSTDGTTFVEIATVTAGVTIYKDNGLTPNTLYYYRVRAYNAAGHSGYSNVVQIRTRAR